MGAEAALIYGWAPSTTLGMTTTDLVLWIGQARALIAAGRGRA